MTGTTQSTAMPCVIDSAPYEAAPYRVWLLPDGTVEKRIVRAQGMAPDTVSTFPSFEAYWQAKYAADRVEVRQAEGTTGGQRIHGPDVYCAACGRRVYENGPRRTPPWCPTCGGREWTTRR